jgi:hypothetical protein
MRHVSCDDCGLRFSGSFAAVGQELYFEPPAGPRVIPPHQDSQ